MTHIDGGPASPAHILLEMGGGLHGWGVWHLLCFEFHVTRNTFHVGANFHFSVIPTLVEGSDTSGSRSLHKVETTVWWLGVLPRETCYV